MSDKVDSIVDGDADGGDDVDDIDEAQVRKFIGTSGMPGDRDLTLLWITNARTLFAGGSSSEI